MMVQIANPDPQKIGKPKDLDDVKPIFRDKEYDQETFLTEMRERYSRCIDFDSDLRLMALEDIKFTFVPGNQWDTYTQGLRADRPCYEINKVRQSIRQITGAQLQNRPGAKVRAVEEGDTEGAEIREGIIRNIEAVSHADRAYDMAFNYSATGGYGLWRIITDYRDEDDFDQDIYIKACPNPFAGRCDPNAREFDRRDAMFWFFDDKMPRKAFQAKYPDADISQLGGDSMTTCADDMLHWFDQDDVVVSEYWYKKPIKRTIYQLSDGAVVDAEDFTQEHIDAYAAQGVTIKNTKEVDGYKIYQDIVCGTQRLEGPYEWAGKYIPFVPVWGDLINIEGRDVWSGAVRFSKDPQRLFNFSESTKLEMMANQPQQPLTGPVEAITGLESYYNSLSDSNVPFLPYNLVPNAPNGGRPERLSGTVFPAAWAQMSAEQSDNIKATMGIYDASLGARSNETSGRAINARKAQGDVANFVYNDNLSKAMAYTYEILGDLIPKVIDTDRAIRILGKDGAEKWIRVNHAIQNPQTGQWMIENDLNQGKFDYAVTAGSSFTTQRQELADAAMQLGGQGGPFGLMWQYVFLKNSDLPNTEETTEWMRQFLVKQGLAPPDENTPQAPPQQPDPRIESDIAKNASAADKNQADALLSHAKATEIMALLPTNVANTHAKTEELTAKAVRNVAETHQGIEDRVFSAPPIPMYTNPTPVTPTIPSGGF